MIPLSMCVYLCVKESFEACWTKKKDMKEAETWPKTMPKGMDGDHEVAGEYFIGAGNGDANSCSVRSPLVIPGYCSGRVWEKKPSPSVTPPLPMNMAEVDLRFGSNRV